MMKMKKIKFFRIVNRKNGTKLETAIKTECLNLFYQRSFVQIQTLEEFLYTYVVGSNKYFNFV